MSLSPTYASPPVNKRSRVKKVCFPHKFDLVPGTTNIGTYIATLPIYKWNNAAFYSFCKFPRNHPGGLSTFLRPVWPLLLYGHSWYSGSSASTRNGGEGKQQDYYLSYYAIHNLTGLSFYLLF